MDGRVVCFGEVLLRLSAPGRERLLQTPRLEACIGGAEANVAVSLARFGHPAAMVGRVADNALGAAARGELARHGVEVSALPAGPGRQGLYFLATGAGARPSEVLYDRADSAFARLWAEDLDWPALLAGARHLHLSGVTPALGGGPAAAAIAAVEAAGTLGVPVSFDGNFRPTLWAARGVDPRPDLQALFHGADLAFADARDVDLLLGPGDDAPAAPDARFAAAARRAFAAFPRLGTMAALLRTVEDADSHRLGAVLATRAGELLEAAPMRVSGIVDRIGAGDAFAAGVLHGRLAGLGALDGLRFGLGAAVLKHSIPGDFNLVSREEVEGLVAGERVDVRR